MNCDLGILSEHTYSFASLTPAPASTLPTVDSGEADDDWGDFESSSPAPLSCSTSMQHQSILPTPLATSNQSNVIQSTPFNLEAQPQGSSFSSGHLKSLPSVSVSPTNFAATSPKNGLNPPIPPVPVLTSKDIPPENDDDDFGDFVAQPAAGLGTNAILHSM